MAHANWSKNSVCRIAIIGVCEGQSIVAVHHFEAPGTTEATLTSDTVARTWADSVADDWVTNCKAAWLIMKPSTYTLLNVQSQVLERPAQFEHVLTPTDRTPAAPVVGGVTGTADDMTTAAVIKWRSDVAGKSHRGRTYVGPLTDAQTEAGRVLASTVTNLTAYLDLMQNRYTGASALFTQANLTIYSRPYNEGQYRYVKGSGSAMEIVIPGDYNGDSTHVIGGTVDTILRSQRRRQIGVGS